MVQHSIIAAAIKICVRVVYGHTQITVSNVVVYKLSTWIVHSKQIGVKYGTVD